jgi:hypothetical protein
MTDDVGRDDVVTSALHERLRQLASDLQAPATSRATYQYRRTVPNRIRLVEHLLALHANASMTPDELLVDLDRLLEGSTRDERLTAVGPSQPEIMHEAAQIARIVRAHMTRPK